MHACNYSIYSSSRLHRAELGVTIADRRHGLGDMALEGSKQDANFRFRTIELVRADRVMQDEVMAWPGKSGKCAVCSFGRTCHADVW